MSFCQLFCTNKWLCHFDNGHMCHACLCHHPVCLRMTKFFTWWEAQSKLICHWSVVATPGSYWLTDHSRVYTTPTLTAECRVYIDLGGDNADNSLLKALYFNLNLRK